MTQTPLTLLTTQSTLDIVISSESYAVRFSVDSVPSPQDDQLVTQHSSIGDVGLKPDTDGETVRSLSVNILKAELDFGILREGHTWQASACTLPGGTQLLEAQHGDLITDVCIQNCASFDARDGEVDDKTMEDSIKTRVVVTIKPREIGPFDDQVKLVVCNEARQIQAISLRVHGSIMSAQKGTPMAKPGVVRLDPSRH
jgi:hypothetical protein